MRCHNCGSDKTESDASSGTSYCVNCGTVLEENQIVSEVSFGETAGGKAVLQGSYAGESGRISGGGLFGRSRGREGQEQAIENGRVRISSLAHAVHLPERYRDAAQRYYNLAVVNRFTRGRRSDHVAAVCLYAVCRTEKSSHMLIDFSDILQVNVFKLGATFLKLCRILNLTLPHVDPSLYISRFAVALDFGDYTQRVAQDAVRIAQRMDRDWITSGRRPAGICGACLLIAARMNGFRRTTREMIYVVKVADITIQKRLHEFNQTESAQLSVRDFRTIWLEKRADPPSFQKNRKVHENEENSSESPELTDSSTPPSKDDVKIEEDNVTTLGKRKANCLHESTQNQQSVDKGKGKMHVSPSKRQRKGKDRATEDTIIDGVEADMEIDGNESDGEPLSDDEVDGPFIGNQVGITSADNCVPDSKAADSNKKKSTAPTEKDTEEELIKKQIEDSLNDEIRQLAEVDASLTAEATLKPKEDDTESTQVGTQVTHLDPTQPSDEFSSTLVDDGNEELGSTLVNESQSDYIPIKDPYYESLPADEKAALTALAKAKVAKEVNDLLNPELQEDAKAIADDMEAWLGDDSINKAATEIETQRHKINKPEDEEEEEEEEEEDDGNLSDVDDEEIDAMILTENEVALKTKIWYNANKEYLEEMAVRRLVEKDRGGHSRRGRGIKKKKTTQPSTPAEAAKQLLLSKKLSKKINQAVFDDMFESAESIAKIKQRDAILRMGNNVTLPLPSAPEYEVVEEPGDIPDPKAKKTDDSTEETADSANAAPVVEEDEDDEDMDSDDMADDERLMRDARAKYAFDEDDDAQEYLSDDGY
ncbi:hypothetical protein INT47_000093 [Mucor saturninus]|uniref:B-related factor 1 n=1 Tax=Mucor saturninus TaxID=64648 RepID=A0A8H7V5J3_9FUNG|nr:hypothetical protein INT47_000093 [Mucor saturninus]